MYIRLSILFVLVFTIFSCQEKEKPSNSAEAAFAKIDMKNKTLFTEEDKKRSYEKSIALSNERNSSLKKNVTYNGYGASVNKNQHNSKSKKKSNSPKKKKNASYSYKRSSSSQTYSAYSTN